MTQEYTLRAMAKNYAGGHCWDHLDGDACIKAADEIARLREAKKRGAAPCGATRCEPKEAPEWLWYGEVNGSPVVSYGRWPRHGAVWRYKYADIQPTEHDKGRRPKDARQAFEEIIASLNYDGTDADSLTVGEIRRALP